MRPFLRAVSMVSLCFAYFLLVGVSAQAPPRGWRPYESKFNSLSQACYGVLEDACPPNSADRLYCLMLNQDKNDNHECNMWLGWRTVCLSFVEVKLVPNGFCGFTKEESTPELVRQCLGIVDKKELPELCHKSPYYKSLKLHSPRLMDDEGDL
ncbi:hypothetical protein ABB37_05029 [Leptomonas pyrrhocoris]|uniref:Uncharacterized protein n=1 Tax=Leptomonas pyrrhocoris TaxID=157538 RepID=A0A0M9G0R4_LEPPY|nr:hypothetical protein ABB37_05029 [Leptomonas pyrrhocoris]XP_015658434.1 hypothetical protein ABB37_05029 [Leptomonas pyrrhocoris]KPA79994.1 hypothetical protein ABB37_05029 [Leptomonas pyrrhocoris]KPA79995.1 hypothetical protein ABB37_05029 [Leptomonas pyrrhocoris]|eukprot:XP_015658433.1 hypothetical protein ABB37_05029 [Leptomonas pyrrhocoris]